MPKPVIGAFSAKKGCTYLEIDGKKEMVARFAAKVTREIVVNCVDGTCHTDLEISGTREGGLRLEPFRCPADPAQLLKAVSKRWGTATTIRPNLPAIKPAELKRRFAAWILDPKRISRREQHYAYTGFTFGDPPTAFVLRSERIGAKALGPSRARDLPAICVGDRPPLPLNEEDLDLTQSIQRVLAVAEPSEGHSLVTCLPLLVALRAVTATFRPTDGLFYFLGENLADLSALARLARACFGEFDRTAPPVMWEVPEKELLAGLRATRHGVLVLQDTALLADAAARRRIDKKIERILKTVWHCDVTEGCQVIGVGPWVPKLDSPSLHTQILYVEVAAEDFEKTVLDPLWSLAEEGVLFGSWQRSSKTSWGIMRSARPPSTKHFEISSQRHNGNSPTTSNEPSNWHRWSPPGNCS